MAGATLTGTNLSNAVLEPGDESGGTSLVSLVQTLCSGAVISLGVFLFVADWSLWWAVFVVGFVAVLSAATKLVEWYGSRPGDESPEGVDDEQTSALATLRDR